MAKKTSKRVMDQRKANFDQISFLIETGGRKLIRTLALREECPGSELIRRSILARAGLRVLPYRDDLALLDDVQDRAGAVRAIHRLQNREAASEIINHLADELGAERSEARYKVTLDLTDVTDLRNTLQKVENAIDEDQPVTVTLTGMEIGTLRRMLSNIELDE